MDKMDKKEKRRDDKKKLEKKIDEVLRALDKITNSDKLKF